MQGQHLERPGHGNRRDGPMKRSGHGLVVFEEMDLYQMIAVESYNGRQPDEIDAGLACPAFDAARILPAISHDIPVLMTKRGFAQKKVSGTFRRSNSSIY